MSDNGTLMRAIFALLGASVLAAPAGPVPAGEPRLLDVERIWGSAPHNGFTDLVRFKDRWYCAFREGQSRTSQDGAVRILTSADGVHWVSAAALTMREADLREPKLSVTPDRRLMVTAAAHTASGDYRGQSLAWFSSDGRTWADAIEIGDPNFWLWRLAWRQDRAYGVGYGGPDKPSLRLYMTRDALQYDVLVDNLAGEGVAGEGSLLFLSDDTALCLLHKDRGGSALGRARPPYRAWTWKDVNIPLEAPHLLSLSDGRIVAAGSTATVQRRTVLCWLDPDAAALKEFLALPSGGEDGYPGLVFQDGTLWVSYDSSHEGKPGIYVARVKIG